MSEQPYPEHPCRLCDGFVQAGEDESKWGFDWYKGYVHFSCIENIFDAARRVRNKPEVALLEAENKAATTHIREIIETTKAQRTEIEELIADLTQAREKLRNLCSVTTRIHVNLMREAKMNLSERINYERFLGNCGERAGEWAIEAAQLIAKIEKLMDKITDINVECLDKTATRESILIVLLAEEQEDE